MEIPTDKTNSTRIISTTAYEDMVRNHLTKTATPISCSALQEIYKSAEDVLCEMGHHPSKDKYLFLEESLKSRSIPTPKLLIKDHKPLNVNGE